MLCWKWRCKRGWRITLVRSEGKLASCDRYGKLRMWSETFKTHIKGVHVSIVSKLKSNYYIADLPTSAVACMQSNITTYEPSL